MHLRVTSDISDLSGVQNKQKANSLTVLQMVLNSLLLLHLHNSVIPLMLTEISLLATTSLVLSVGSLHFL